MTEVVEQTEAAPVEAPADQSAPASASADDIDRLLAEYDAGTKPEPASDGNGGNKPPTDAPVQDDELDRLLSGLPSKDQERIAGLESEINSLTLANHQRVEQEAFDKFSDELQSRLPDHAHPDFAKDALLAAASRDPALVAAWDVRNVSAAERTQAPALLQQAIQLYQKIQQSPDTDPRKVQALNCYLEAVVHGPGILRKAVREIEDRAHKFQPIDAEASALKADIAWNMQRGQGKVTAEPPPDFGKMDSAEYRRTVKSLYGYDPGT
jgi:hypothetical protein